MILDRFCFGLRYTHTLIYPVLTQLLSEGVILMERRREVSQSDKVTAKSFL
jgi:hypothetical protein